MRTIPKLKLRLSVSRITLLGMLLALLIALKYALGFVPGIELISFMFITLGIILPLVDLTLLIVCFNLLIVVMYGFGNWWWAYWIIWPADAFISKFIKIFTKNKFVFGIWGFIGGFSVFFWYFLSDWLFFGENYAIANLITAAPINLIEGFTTMIFCITASPLLIKAISHSYDKFYEKTFEWRFNETKYVKLNWFATIFIICCSIGGIVTLFIYNSFFFELKNKLNKPSHLLKVDASKDSVTHSAREDVVQIYNDSDVDGDGVYLSNNKYNQILNQTHKDEVAIVIIADEMENGHHVHHLYKQFVKWKANAKVWDMLEDSDFEFNIYRHHTLGVWLGSFRMAGEKQWRHGNNSSHNYNDYYPLYLANHIFATLGVSNRDANKRDIYEISYNHNS